MDATSENARLIAYRRVSNTAGVLVAAVGLLVIAGWLGHIELLQTVLPGLASMKFNTAVGFVIAGSALCAMQQPPRQRRHPVALFLLAALLLLACLTIAEYRFGFDLGIDEAIIRDIETPGSGWPGRMSIGTAGAFILIALALLTLDVEVGAHWRPAQSLCLIAAAVGGIALLGYLFDVQALYRFGAFSSMALHTALLIVVISIGILLARPESGAVAAMTSDRPGGRLLRLLLPAVVGVPILLNWLFLIGVDAGGYSAQFGFALSSFSSIVILSVIVWFGAYSLNSMHARLDLYSRRSARLAAIVSSSDDAIIGTDLKGKVTSWNDAAERLFGYSADEIIGQPIYRIVPDDKLEEAQKSFDAVRRRKRVDRLETERLRKDGSIIELSINISPIKDETGAMVGVSKISRDISEQKRSEALFRRTVEASPTGIIISDADGQIVLANPEAEKVFGYREGELIDANIDTLLPARLRASHARSRKSFAGTPKARRMGAGRDLTGLRKDGVEFPAEIGLSAVEAHGRILVVVSIVDITERKRHEEALRARTDELARSNRDLEQFAYVASHDLQEPLRGISGCVQLLQKRYEGKLDERADEFIGHTVDGVRRMQRLIEDLLMYSRVGRVEDAIQSVDCNAILDAALENLATVIDETGVQIERDNLPVVAAIPGELVLVFQNLVGNAVKFRRKGIVPEVAISVECSHAEWLFSVKDNGIGIEAAYFDRIFDIFQRLHTRREYPGTGIGLPLCKRIVEKHGGRIWLESEPGVGTAFFFTLPFRQVGEGAPRHQEK